MTAATHTWKLLPDVHDVIVIGGGPGGLYAGLRLAQRGLDVVVLEEHQVIGDPVHCTGILAREAFEEFGLSRDSILNELTTARFISPAGNDIIYRTNAVEAVAVDRGLFDARLARDARQAGARIVLGARVSAVRCDADSVSVDVPGKPTFRARACVLACGGRYALHRQLGLELPPLLLHTAQREMPAKHPGEVEVHFGRHVAPGGFGWAVPVWRGEESFVRIGVMSERSAPKHFQQLLERIGPRWGIETTLTRPPRQKILPLARISRTYKDRLIVVGDAAGLVKPTTGGGIYYSLLSAFIGADILAGALDRDDVTERRLAEYERRWRARLKPELDTQQSFRALAQGMSDEDIECLFTLARTDGVMPIVRRTASFNRHRRLILALLKHPPARQLFFRSLVS